MKELIQIFDIGLVASPFLFLFLPLPPFAIQFPTLGFVVERYWEVQSHEPEEFWVINCSHKSDEGIATFNWMYAMKTIMQNYFSF